MRLVHYFRICTWISLIIPLSLAHSTFDPPLSHIEYLSPSHFEIIPRHRDAIFSSAPSELRHDDSFRIHFKSFNKTFHLHLEPNPDFLHPDATITVHKPGGNAEIIPLRDERVYKGWVTDNAEIGKRWWDEDWVGIERHDWSREHAIGWARIVVHEHPGDKRFGHFMFEGAFSGHGNVYHIKPIHKYRLVKRAEDPDFPHTHPWGSEAATMVIYRDSDQLSVSGLSKRGGGISQSCGMEEMSPNFDPTNPVMALRRHRSLSPLAKLSEYSPFHHSKFLWEFHHEPQPLFRRAPKHFDGRGCPKSRLINYMGVAADCTFVDHHQSAEDVRKQIITDFNTASVVYERSFNISLGIIFIEIYEPPCSMVGNDGTGAVPWNRDCSEAYTINQRLSDFSYWRGQRGEDGVGLWHLMTKCNTDSKIGVAWLGQLCTSTSSIQQTEYGQNWVSGTGVSSITRDQWKIIAHEVGHGFGALHDCTSLDCPCTNGCRCCPLSLSQCDSESQYLMNPISNFTSDVFSPCSISDICFTVPSVGYCLKPPGQRRVESLSVCGNAILEEDEECDPGKQEDQCCYSNCTLKAHAVCSDLNNQCCDKCQLKPANVPCRPAISHCDIPEMCTGTNPDCPSDNHIPDGTDCGPDGLKCASGQCTSRDAQCMARGNRVNITEECSFEEFNCAVVCTDPTSGHNCLQLNGFFIDGTPCGYGGMCVHGQCQPGSIINTINGWINRYKHVAIPVIVVISLLLLLVIVHFTFFCVQRRRRKNRAGPAKKTRRFPFGRPISSTATAITTDETLQESATSVPPAPTRNETPETGKTTRAGGARRSIETLATESDADGWVAPTLYNGSYTVQPAYAAPSHELHDSQVHSDSTRRQSRDSNPGSVAHTTPAAPAPFEGLPWTRPEIEMKDMRPQSLLDAWNNKADRPGAFEVEEEEDECGEASGESEETRTISSLPLTSATALK
ncbi:uncharacterized protein VTP21DRAFT_11524 [Calcarisporiella thermophila]|uniref:uncharacterized protein n=1 Tax=Calcarisporiella thermophila TaxID=911321 RepID=UPI003743840B